MGRSRKSVANLPRKVEILTGRPSGDPGGTPILLTPDQPSLQPLRNVKGVFHVTSNLTLTKAAWKNLASLS